MAYINSINRKNVTKSQDCIFAIGNHTVGLMQNAAYSGTDFISFSNPKWF